MMKKDALIYIIKAVFFLEALAFAMTLIYVTDGTDLITSTLPIWIEMMILFNTIYILAAFTVALVWYGKKYIKSRQ